MRGVSSVSLLRSEVFGFSRVQRSLTRPSIITAPMNNELEDCHESVQLNFLLPVEYESFRMPYFSFWLIGVIRKRMG